MLINRFTQEMSKSLRSRMSWDFKFALYLITGTALLNLLWFTYNLGYLEGVVSTSQQHISGGDPFMIKNGRIAIALIMAAVALWPCRTIGFLFSILALSYIGFEYVTWYQDSSRALRMLEFESWADFQDPSFPYVGKLRGAVWWNMVVLVISVTLLLWQLKTLLKFLAYSRNR